LGGVSYLSTNVTIKPAQTIDVTSLTSQLGSTTDVSDTIRLMNVVT